MRFRSSRLIGYTIQAITIYLGINIIYSGHILIGLLVALGSLFANVALKSAKVKKDSLKSTFKLSLLSLGIVIWMMSGSRSNILQDRGDDTLHSRTHNIITPDSRSHSYRAKHSIKATKTNVKVHKAPKSHINTDQPAISNTETADEKNRDTKDKSSRKKREKRKYVIRRETNDDKEINSDKKVGKEIDRGDIKWDKNEEDIVFKNVNDKSIALITETFGKLPISEFPDLKYRPPEEVQTHLERIFKDLPDQFLAEYKVFCEFCMSFHYLLSSLNFVVLLVSISSKLT
jgi:hypothetical protein